MNTKPVAQIVKEIWVNRSHYKGAAAELCHLKEIGIWPKHRPYMNALTQALRLEGYPNDQVENIARNVVADYAISFLYIMG